MLIFSETHMCTHTISSQLKMKEAQRLRELTCLFKDEKLGKKSVLSESVSSDVAVSRLVGAFMQHRGAAAVSMCDLRRPWFDHQSTQWTCPHRPPLCQLT